MNRRITPRPFAAALAKAATVLDIGATSVSKTSQRYRVVLGANAQQTVSKDWATVGREMFSVSAGEVTK